MTKNKIIVLSLILFLIFSFLLTTRSLAGAFDSAAGTPADLKTKAQGYADKVEDDESVTSAGRVVGAIITIVRVISLGVAVIMLIVLAMKYMMAAPGDRADIKKHAVVYIVGAVILFATSGILSILQNFATNFG